MCFPSSRMLVQVKASILNVIRLEGSKQERAGKILDASTHLADDCIFSSIRTCLRYGGMGSNGHKRQQDDSDGLWILGMTRLWCIKRRLRR